jgi:hypothetical protein
MGHAHAFKSFGNAIEESGATQQSRGPNGAIK